MNLLALSGNAKDKRMENKIKSKMVQQR